MKGFSLILLAALLFNGIAMAQKPLTTGDRTIIEKMATLVSKKLKVSTTVAVLYCKENACSCLC